MAGKTPASRRRAQRADKPSDKEARALERASALLSKDPTLSKSAALRGAGVTEAREVRRLVAKLTAPASKTKAPAPSRTAATQGRPQVAMPLRASVPKKVGLATQPANQKKRSDKADYHPRTEVPPLQEAPQAGVMPVTNLLAIARPWMMLGLQMTITGFTLQARMARAAMQLTPAAAAMRQGAKATNAWLAAVYGYQPKAGKS